MDATVRQLSAADAPAIAEVINAAAERYRGRIPAAADTDPYMPVAELREELDRMTCYGIDRDGLAGVIGIEESADVSLVRHLYVRPDVQREGLGGTLLAAGLDRAASSTVLVGTWAAADWAIAFYEAHGFERVDDPAALLETYWDVPAHQRAASVVLRYEREG